jgi:hypothetical protein
MGREAESKPRGNGRDERSEPGSDFAPGATKRRIMVAAHKVDTLAHFSASGKSAKDGLCKS